MSDFLKLNNNLIDRIKKLTGDSFLLLQNSIYQKDSLISSIVSLFNEKEIIKMNAKDFSQKNLEDFDDNLSQYSIFSSIKICIIEDVNLLKSEIEKNLLEILKNLPENTIVILTASSILKSNILYKYHVKNNVLVDKLSIQEKDILLWIKEELNKVNLKKYETNLPSLILESANKNIDKIKEIIDYLEIYIKDNTITNKEFLRLFPIENEISDFKILDPIYSANFVEYEKILKKILTTKNQFLLISIFISNFSQLLEIKFYQIQKIPSEKIAEKMKMQDWLVKKNLNIISRYSFSQLKNNLSKILLAEVKLKDINISVMSVFENLFFSLAPDKLLIRK